MGEYKMWWMLLSIIVFVGIISGNYLRDVSLKKLHPGRLGLDDIPFFVLSSVIWPVGFVITIAFFISARKGPPPYISIAALMPYKKNTKCPKCGAFGAGERLEMMEFYSGSEEIYRVSYGPKILRNCNNCEEHWFERPLDYEQTLKNSPAYKTNPQHFAEEIALLNRN